MTCTYSGRPDNTFILELWFSVVFFLQHFWFSVYNKGEKNQYIQTEAQKQEVELFNAAVRWWWTEASPCRAALRCCWLQNKCPNYLKGSAHPSSQVHSCDRRRGASVFVCGRSSARTPAHLSCHINSPSLDSSGVLFKSARRTLSPRTRAQTHRGSTVHMVTLWTILQPRCWILAASLLSRAKGTT